MKDNHEEFFHEVNGYMNDFYNQRGIEISSTLEDLCLVYDVAAKAIFDSIVKQDIEAYKLLYDNQHFIKMLPYSDAVKYGTPETEAKLKKAFEIMKGWDDFLQLPPEILQQHEIDWVVYNANLLRMYDEVFV